MEHNPGFLKKKYDLHTSPEVESAARKHERQADKPLRDPEARIQNFLDRLKHISEHKTKNNPERGVESLKRILHDNYVIKPEAIPEGYFENQRRIAREQGHGDIEIDQEMRRQLTEAVIADQESSLDTWLDYLTSDDAPYPDWLKYFAVRSVLGMADYDKEKQAFTKRSNGTTKPFPSINQEALGKVFDLLEKKYEGQGIDLTDLEDQDKEKLEKLLQGENFAKLYAWAIEKFTPASAEALTITQGTWIRYQQGSDYRPLVKSLEGHSTGWCTATSTSIAESQLKGGDFYVYYSLDQQGQPTIPRVAIRMSGNSIGEVRGIADQQNLDPYIGEVAQKKLAEFPDGKLYEKKASDMRYLTRLEKKSQQGQALTRDDLTFLYEVEAKIQGFGYQDDPRIKELRQDRSAEQDMLTIFEATPDQIAHSVSEINQSTKAYVGLLEPGIFTNLQAYDVEHIYTSFPEGKIRRGALEIGGTTKEKLQQELNALDEQGNPRFQVSSNAESMIKNRDFTTLENSESVELVRLQVRDLGFTNSPTTDQLYERAEKLGLELCPAEVGPQLRLQYTNQSGGEYLYIAMKQITGSDDSPDVFKLRRSDDGLWLDSDWARPSSRWGLSYRLVFRLRK